MGRLQKRKSVSLRPSIYYGAQAQAGTDGLPLSAWVEAKIFHHIGDKAARHARAIVRKLEAALPPTCDHCGK